VNWFWIGSGGGEKGWDAAVIGLWLLLKELVFAGLAKGLVDCRSNGETTGVEYPVWLLLAIIIDWRKGLVVCGC